MIDDEQQKQRNKQVLLKRLIEEAIEGIMEQNALSAGAIAGTSGTPLGMKPHIFDPEKPKKKKRTRINKNK